MGSTTLVVRRQRLAEWLGIPSHHTIPTHISAALTAFIQDSLRELYAYHPWEFLRYSTRIELFPGTNDGTVACTDGSTAVTGTGTAFPTSWSGSYIRIRIGNEIYPVASIGSATGLTLSVAALTTQSGESYYLYQDVIVLGATLRKLLADYVSTPASRVIPIGPAEMAQMKGAGILCGHPQYMCSRGVDSNGYTEVELWPVPYYAEFLHVEGVKAGTIPTADGNTDDVPTEFSHVVDCLARKLMFAWKKDERYAIEEGRSAVLLAKMVDEHRFNRGPEAISLDPTVFGLPPYNYEDGHL